MEYRAKGMSPQMDTSYERLGSEQVYHFEIHRIEKESRESEKTFPPWIRLFCKSSGKCGV